jgi:DNA-binding phage protein
MSQDFDDLADRVKATWSHDTHRVYEAASGAFAAELDGRIELGAAIATARKARCLTQVALSELAGVQQAEISRIERGSGNPTAATLLRLADALGQKVILVPAESR